MKKPQRIKLLFIVNVDWFFVSHRLNLALKAISRGYEVHIACKITDKKTYLENLGLIVHKIDISRSGKNPIREIKTFIQIFKTVKRLNPDIIHLITHKPVIYGGIASRILEIDKKVFSISGLGFIFIANGLKYSIIRFIITSLYKFALGSKNSTVIIQNSKDADIVSKIKTIPMVMIKSSGVDLSKYRYIAEKNNTKVIVTMASRFLKDKGVFEYNEAAKILKDKNLKVQFKLYGTIDKDNPSSLTTEELNKIKRDNNLEINNFTDEISRVFYESNIVVLPSYREGSPKVLAEASACGRAIVTTDVPGCRDVVIPNTTALLCKAKDSNSLATQIEILISNPKLREKMGKAGRRLAEKEFDINKIVKQHFEIYERKA